MTPELSFAEQFVSYLKLASTLVAKGNQQEEIERAIKEKRIYIQFAFIWDCS